MPSSEATWQFKIMFEVISTIVMKLTGPWFPVRKLLEIPKEHIPILLINHDKSQCVSFKIPGFSMDPCPRHRPVEERLTRYLQKREKKNDLNEETGTWDAENVDRHVDVSNQHWQFQIETYFPNQTWFVSPFNVDSISKMDVIV